MVVEESIVDHMTCPLPLEGQPHHLRGGGAGPLREALQGNVLQQSVVTNSTEQVDLKDCDQLSKNCVVPLVVQFVVGGFNIKQNHNIPQSFTSQYALTIKAIHIGHQGAAEHRAKGMSTPCGSQAKSRVKKSTIPFLFDLQRPTVNLYLKRTDLSRLFRGVLEPGTLGVSCLRHDLQRLDLTQGRAAVWR